MWRRKFLILASCVLASPWAAAVDGVSPTTILIGQSITLEGGKNEYEMAVLDGMQTYLQAVNQRGGVKGRKIVLKTLDDAA